MLDDLLKDSEEARSELICRSVIEWLQTVALTRLSQRGKVVAIGTRWSDRDPLGWLLREQRGWEVLHLPAVCERPDDPLGRPMGAPLWGSQYPLHALQSIRLAIGPQAWRCLYQGDPISAAGTIFKRDWFNRFSSMPESFQKIIQSWDTAFKANTGADYSAVTTWGTTENAFYLLSAWRGRVEFPELRKQVALQAEQWKPHAVVVEDKASGQSLLQELKNSTAYPVVAVKVDSDKVTRASAVTAFFEAGKVFFPQGAAWLPDFEDELAGFPGAAHDDYVDSLTQALNYLRGDSGELGVIERLKKGLSCFMDFWRGDLSPRTELLGKQRAVEFEMQARGLKANQPEAWKLTPDPCPECNSRCTVQLGARVHCNECGRDSGPEPIVNRGPTRGQWLRSH